MWGIGKISQQLPRNLNRQKMFCEYFRKKNAWRKPAGGDVGRSSRSSRRITFFSKARGDGVYCKLTEHARLLLQEVQYQIETFYS
jgi:hypothetical protein